MGSNVALAVIDVQLGMFDAPGEPPVPGGERLLEEGTEKWKVHPRIAPLDGDPTVTKRTPDSFLDTTLREDLGSRDIESLVLAGMQTEYCVDTTCRRAFSLGYDVTLVKDAPGTWDNDDLSAAQIIAHHNEVLGSWFATAVNADEVRFEEPATQ